MTDLLSKNSNQPFKPALPPHRDWLIRNQIWGYVILAAAIIFLILFNYKILERRKNINTDVPIHIPQTQINQEILN